MDILSGKARQATGGYFLRDDENEVSKSSQDNDDEKRATNEGGTPYDGIYTGDGTNMKHISCNPNELGLLVSNIEGFRYVFYISFCSS